MTRYRKKPVEVDAIQLRWATLHEVHDFLGDALALTNTRKTTSAADVSDTCGEDGPYYLAVEVLTVHGDFATVRHGDWIIADAEPGTFYPCKPAVFQATYELVTP